MILTTDFNISKNRDVYSITTTRSDITLNLQFKSDCNNFNNVISRRLVPNEDYTIPLTRDGIYQINLVDSDSTLPVEIRYTVNLRNSLIEDISRLVCEEDCPQCESCKVEDLNSTLLKAVTYSTLLRRTSSGVIDTVFSFLECNGLDLIYLNIFQEEITGQANDEAMTNKLLAYYYLSFYFAELQMNTDDNYVNEVFNINTMRRCVSNQGICFEDIKERIESMATMTINSAAYINRRPTCVGDISISADNRATTVLTLAMFTTSTTPPYSDPENDPADAVRIDSLPADGTLALNDVPVTQGQIITAVDINAGDLTYTSPDQDALDTDTINFSVRDSGSMLFTSDCV